MAKCLVRQSLVQTYSVAAAELNRTVGNMTAGGFAGGEAFQSTRSEFLYAKCTADTAREALETHERDHRCGPYCVTLT